MECFKSLDKTEEEIIKSFVKQKWSLLERWERHDHDTHGLYPLQTLLTIWFDGYGTTNRKHKSLGRWNYKYFQYDHVGQGARQVGSTFKPLFTQLQ
jgi:penicillin-binding protein 1A